MQLQRRRTVIAVDDDEINLMILIKSAQEIGYLVKPFPSGEAAWDYLQSHPTEIDIALLDKMMPGMSGIDLLIRMKESPTLKHIPVIIQTGDVGIEQMREGLENGAFYYLTKPFHPQILGAILNSAAAECCMREELLLHMSKGHAQFITLMHAGSFEFKTHAEAQILAAALSQAANYPEFAAIGLMELFANAIEHGNLGFGTEKKRELLLNNQWAVELAKRANSDEFGRRLVTLHIEKTALGLHLVIKDQGEGFDWRYHIFEDRSASRLNEPNGRGISKAMVMLDNVTFTNTGSEVHCDIPVSNSLLSMNDKPELHRRLTGN